MRLALGGLLVAVLCAVPIGPAHADAAGLACGFTSTDDPTGAVANPGTQVGEITGGPVAAANLPAIDDDTTPPSVDLNPVTYNPAEVYIICSIQVGGTGVYADPDAVNVTAEGDVVAYLPPTVMSYQAGPTDPVYVCTEWWVFTPYGHASGYLDDTTGEFSTDPNTARCALAASQEMSMAGTVNATGGDPSAAWHGAGPTRP